MRIATGIAISMLSVGVARADATPGEVAAMDSRQLAKLSPVEICNAWHELKLESAREILERKYGFTRQTWWAIGRGFPDIREFMNYSHVVCMWGMPEKEFREVTNMGIKRRLTYRMDGHVFRVYLLNDAVTGNDERPE